MFLCGLLTERMLSVQVRKKSVLRCRRRNRIIRAGDLAGLLGKWAWRVGPRWAGQVSQGTVNDRAGVLGTFGNSRHAVEGVLLISASEFGNCAHASQIPVVTAVSVLWISRSMHETPATATAKSTGYACVFQHVISQLERERLKLAGVQL